MLVTFLFSLFYFDTIDTTVYIFHLPIFRISFLCVLFIVFFLFYFYFFCILFPFFSPFTLPLFSPFYPVVGRGHLPNSIDVTNPPSPTTIPKPRKRLKSRFDSSYFLNSSSNVTNWAFTPAAAASISNKSNASVHSNCAISGMCYCWLLFYSLYFTRTLLTLTFIFFAYLILYLILFLSFSFFLFSFFVPRFFHIYSSIWWC